ncbi:Dor1-domain-containing protein [Panus rudis PR-1116 ss-1]|nr:Dor1-domain-containing protein [Panus rudis PR-1116 ss-1]
MADVPEQDALSELLFLPGGEGPGLPTPEIAEYMAQLTEMPLSALQAEPNELSSSGAQLTNALTTLCYTSYKTFLSLHSTTCTLSDSLNSLSGSVDALLSTLPDLVSSAREFAQETRIIQGDRRKANLVLEHHDKLYDMLALPLLLDSCVRNHNYNDALLLASHADTLAKRFPSNPLIQSVRQECDSRIRTMLGQLLGMLHEQAKLPTLFRAVSFLRKMGVLEEEELALAFLIGRRSYLNNAFEALETEKRTIDGTNDKAKDAYARYLKRFIDTWREGVHDVITQFSAIFLDKAPSSPERVHTLLTTFVSIQLQTLLSLLEETLPLVADPASLNSLLTQLTYCANSFSRLGVDFRGYLAPLFANAVRHAISTELNSSSTAWSNHFPPNYDSDRRKQKDTRKPSEFLVLSSAASSPPIPSSAQLDSIRSNPPNVPPQIIASYPPLAQLTNSILSALNGLRLLAPLELIGDILSALESALAQCGAILLRFSREKPWRDPDRPDATKDEDSIVHAACDVYFMVLVSFCRRALVEGVYSVGLDNVEAVGEELSKVLNDWSEASRSVV